MRCTPTINQTQNYLNQFNAIDLFRVLLFICHIKKLTKLLIYF